MEVPHRFDSASRQVIEFLSSQVPLGMWTVARYDGDDQVYLHITDNDFGLTRGDSVPWSQTYCQHMVTGAGPQAAPDVRAVPVYDAMPMTEGVGVSAYMGAPIRRADGELFGVLCGVDAVAHPQEISEQVDLLNLLTALLTEVLDAELEATAVAHALDAAMITAETDALTGLLNRRGWNRMLALEDERCARFGDPAAVLVLDLDGLKVINDQQGHATGDQTILSLAAVLRDQVRSSDVVARLGGDEFGVLAARTAQTEALELQNRLQGALDRAGVACSIGLAHATLKTGLSAAWHEGDAQMYAAKARRRLALAS